MHCSAARRNQRLTMLSPSDALISASERAIGVYRRFAPISLREACLFEPTCSEYALLAIR
ncbi:membrane protein insertion efficiency factor YidD [Paraburkholderia aspalathi]|uniref:membrane protein insertion efficiency factor YidD n=1 Tax=Paraburkholderia aspalathi TaxID=1324617 RepID=UPI003CC5A52F